jgi:hypothetical protein
MGDIDHNADEVSAWIDAQRRDFTGQVEEMLDRATRRTHEEAVSEVPVDTGKLRDSLQRDGHEVYSPLDYAPHVALGTIYQDGQPYLWEPAERIIAEEVKRLETL